MQHDFSPDPRIPVISPMNLLVIGGGGTRARARVEARAESPRVARVYVAPGNAGTAREDGLANVPTHVDPRARRVRPKKEAIA